MTAEATVGTKANVGYDAAPATGGARVAMFVERFPLLSETFVAAQAAALVEAGLAVDIFALARDPSGTSHPAVVEAELLSRTRFASDHPLHRLADRMGRPYRLCQQLRRWASIRTDRSRKVYDVILCHFGPNGRRALAATRRRAIRGPIWTVFHGYDLSVGMDHANHPYGPLFEHGDRFLPISRFWADYLIASGCPGERIEVRRMGVDCKALTFRPRADNGLTHFITVARLVEKKGVAVALDALAQLRATAPALAWRYEVIGDGPLRHDLERRAASLGIADAVAFMGAKPHAEVARRLSEATVFILPSITAANGDMEGIPVALMEAMATGLAIASTRHSGIPELIEDGVEGLLAPERDAATLAANLARLAGDAALRRRLTAAARAKVERSYNNAVLDHQLVERIVERVSAPAASRDRKA